MITTSIVFMALANSLYQDPIPAPQANMQAPAFTLNDATGKSVSLDDFKGKTVVLEWWNHACPVVSRHYESGGMQALQQRMKDEGVIWLSICSSAPGKQGFVDGPGAITSMTKRKGVPHATLLDPTGVTGKAYQAKTTPHMYLITGEQKIAYQGAIDSNLTGNQNPSEIVNYFVKAYDEVKAGVAVTTPITRPYGCEVKYASH
jgi:glutathione peroxidase-family protein